MTVYNVKGKLGKYQNGIAYMNKELGERLLLRCSVVHEAYIVFPKIKLKTHLSFPMTFERQFLLWAIHFPFLMDHFMPYLKYEGRVGEKIETLIGVLVARTEAAACSAVTTTALLHAADVTH